MNSPLSQAILQAVAWADGFNLALTPFEIWQQLPANATIADVLADITSNEKLVTSLRQQDGLVMLRGREALTAERRERIAVAWPKYRKLRRIAAVLGRMPFVRLVAACNTLALAHGKPDADLDLFIVTASGRIWSARLLCVAVAKLMGGRPSTRTSKDKYCLSFYISEDNMDVQRFTDGTRDHYLVAWTSWVLPLYDAGSYSEKFARANEWVVTELSQTSWDMVSPRWRANEASRTKLIVESIWNDGIERLMEQLQRAYLPQALRDKASENTTSVVLDHTSLKFHLDDRRPSINSRFEQKLAGQFSSGI